MLLGNGTSESKGRPSEHALARYVADAPPEKGHVGIQIMNENVEQRDWVTTGLTIMSAILVFRIVSGLVGIAWNMLPSFSSWTIVVRLRSLDAIIVPLIGVAVAVLTCQWHKRILGSARRKTRMGILALTTVLALFPVQFKISRQVVIPPGGWPSQIENTETEFQQTNAPYSENRGGSPHG